MTKVYSTKTGKEIKMRQDGPCWEFVFCEENAAKDELADYLENAPRYSVKLIRGNVRMFKEANLNEQAYMNYISRL